jgi:hypothetical protein
MDVALREAEHAVIEANRLVRAQEAEVTRMRRVGLDTAHAEALLCAYREGARLAQELQQLLHARFTAVLRIEEQ